MLAWEQVVEAKALRSQGWSISAIARHLGVTRVTVRRYLSGDAVPGERVRSAPDPFDEFAEYARLRLAVIRICGRPRCSTSWSSWATRGRTRASLGRYGSGRCVRCVAPAAKVGPWTGRSSPIPPVRKLSGIGSSCPIRRARGGGVTRPMC
jgi:hypothetical protein